MNNLLNRIKLTLLNYTNSYLANILPNTLKTILSEKAFWENSMYTFKNYQCARNRKRPQSDFSFKEPTGIIEELNNSGFVIIKNVIDKDLLQRVRQYIDNCITSAEFLNPTSKDSQRKIGDTTEPSLYLTREEILNGQDYLRNNTNYVSIAEPILNCPEIVNIAFDELLIDIATHYFKCVPAIGGVNLRKSYINNLTEFDTLYFHSDTNSPVFLKFFCYLNDVDEKGGPFTFIKGSHINRFTGWKSKSRWTYEEMIQQYNKDDIIKLTANAGDLIIANTTGFHRGSKVISNDRYMLTINYVVHPEFNGTQTPYKMRKTDHDSLTPKQKAASDFLEVVSLY